MYELTGVYEAKLRFDGSVSRFKSPFFIQLSTNVGVKRFIEENSPFTEIKITSYGEDVTAEFIGEKN